MEVTPTQGSDISYSIDNGIKCIDYSNATSRLTYQMETLDSYFHGGTVMFWFKPTETECTLLNIGSSLENNMSIYINERKMMKILRHPLIYGNTLL